MTIIPAIIGLTGLYGLRRIHALPVSHALCPLAVQRVVLLSYNAKERRVSFRHYSISTAPSGVTKGVKALVGGRAMPNLSELQDVSELLTRSGYGSVRSLSADCT